MGCWGLDCITSDFPQGNDVAGIKRHNANQSCRVCNAAIEDLTNQSYDYFTNARFLQETRRLVATLEQETTRTAQAQLATRYGLSMSPGPFNKLSWNPHVQTPHDAYHSMTDKARRLLDVTFSVFSASGNAEWNKEWRHIEKPTQWSRMPNPLTHRQSFTFNDVLKLSMLMPIILRRFLKPSHFKTEFLQSMHARLDTSRDTSVIKTFCRLWAVEGKALKQVFATTMTNNTYQDLHHVLRIEEKMLLKVCATTSSLCQLLFN